MAGGIGMSTALQLISGVPLRKVGTVLAEKLHLPKRLDGGALGDLAAKVIKDGNLSAILQNPMAALTGAVQGQIGGLVSQLQGMVGGGPLGLINAIAGAAGVPGLSQAMGALQAAGDNLAGLTSGASGFFAMLGHEALADMAGAALPAAAALAQVTAPLTSGDFLGGLAERLPEVVGAVVSGQMPAEIALDWVLEQTFVAADIVASSAGALAWGQQMQPLLSTAAAVSGALAVPPVFDADGFRQEGVPTGFQGVMRSLVQAGPLAAMDAALAAQIAHVKPVRVDAAAMTSLEG